ncbi:MAG: major outer membrane protein, partial [Campylobacterales bacterium]|nr:major outer membrane protein [Campylobacterales bacterium]
MKLAKLSLAAIVAAGAMTTFASAAPLEEAIKGVDLSGMIRYRIDKTENGESRHRFSGPLTFTIPVADGLKTVLTVRYDDSDYAQMGGGTGESKKDLAISQAYFQYAAADYMLKVGKMQLATPWTENSFDGNFGNGAIAYYTGLDGWTFGAGGYANTNASLPNIGTLLSLPDADLARKNQNLYAAAAIGSAGP